MASLAREALPVAFYLCKIIGSKYIGYVYRYEILKELVKILYLKTILARQDDTLLESQVLERLEARGLLEPLRLGPLGETASPLPPFQRRAIVLANQVINY